ncbi:MAG: MFS transporter [Leadbetterella sp.]|nr:MFS transporter [Leadbetterella sp.]
MKEKNLYLIPFILVTSLFFMWGLANNLTGVLIPHLRKALELSNTQSTLVDTAVYLAYFIAAIPAGILLKKTGYKNGILTGLLIFSAGCFLFYTGGQSPGIHSVSPGLFHYRYGPGYPGNGR